jgi:hypothetical protein
MHKGSHTARAVKQTQTNLNVKTQSAGFYCWKMSSTLHTGVSEGFKLGTAAIRQEGGVTVTAGMRQRRNRDGLGVMVAILLLEFCRGVVCLLRGLAAAAPPPPAREPPPDRTDPPPDPSKILLSSSSSSDESTTHSRPS